MTKPTQPQVFLDHVNELRRRVLWIVLAIGFSGLLGYILRKSVIKFLQHPLGSPLYYTSPAGSFNFVLKVSFVIGIFITLPVIVYHAIRFIEPALPIKIKNSMLVRVIAASFILALIGSAFGFFILVPQSLHFFAGYSSAQIKPLISATEYLNYIMNTLITFAIVFQIPLVILFINHIRPIKPKDVMRYQKHIVVGSFILAVVLPFSYDPISQFIMAIPVVFLFYLSVVLLMIANRNRKYPEKPGERSASLPPALPEAPSFQPQTGGSPSQQRVPAFSTGKRSMDGIFRSPSYQSPKLLVESPLITTPSQSASMVQEQFEANVTPQPKTRAIDGILKPSSLRRHIKLDDTYPYSIS